MILSVETGLGYSLVAMKFRIRVAVAAMILGVALPTFADSGSSFGDTVRQKVDSLLAKEFSLPAEDIEVTYARFPLQAPAEWRRCRFFLRAMQDAGNTGYRSFAFELFLNDRKKHELIISARVAVFENVVVAGEQLPSRSELDAGQLTLERRKISRKRDNYFRDIAEVEGRMSLGLIRQGDPVLRSKIQTLPDVQRGDEVDIRLESRNLTLTMRATARKSGKIGERIPLVCETTGKRLNGVIRSSKLVIIENKDN